MPKSVQDILSLIKENGKYGRSLGLSYPGPEDAERGTFLMGSDRQEYTRTQLTSILRSILSETDPEVPVYAVFHCDSDKILHKEESEIIKEALRSFRETEYSNFYYQVLEE